MYQNTLSDLRDCLEDMEERVELGYSIDAVINRESTRGFKYKSELLKDEADAQKRLIEMCKEIVDLGREKS
jgi:hypothetical protein